MSHISYKTKDGSSPSEKRRVYFTCHPEDFEKCFKKVCEDIFRTHDCAVYYTEDMNEEISDQDKEVDIGSNNLFVLPITYKLLFTPNRAIDVDFPYAKSAGMPILPIIMEMGVGELYSGDGRFGELQYLNSYSSDNTEISYAEKLKKYLDAILISDEMAKRIRAAFDAYIFLSYRKKDRAYANELMQIIHRNPECRDIAVWYDEFLTPGESFKDNILKMMNDSKLFALLVTPNLLEEPDGKPNYVMGEEYPAAREMGLPILPAEMQSTDKEILRLKFQNIPSCVDPHQEQIFHDLLLQSLSRIAKSENNNDPEHNFLIGLAYYEGIDVETNRERGVEIITEAAEAGLLEAMRWLVEMYQNKYDDHTALSWKKKIVQFHEEKSGKSHVDTLEAMQDLTRDYFKLGDAQKAFEIREEVYHLALEAFGENDPFVLRQLSSLANGYWYIGNTKKEAETQKEIYEKTLQLYGKNHWSTISELENLASKYGHMGDNIKALQLRKEVYRWNKRRNGKKHCNTVWALGHLAWSYRDIGNYKKALRLMKRIYSLECQAAGVENSSTISALYDVAVAYFDLGMLKKAGKLTEKVYESRSKLLGEEHYETIETFIKLAQIYDRMENKTGISRIKQTLIAFEKEVKEDSFEAACRLNSLAKIYLELHEYEKVVQLRTQIYDMSCRLFGGEHWITRQELGRLADVNCEFANYIRDIGPIYKAIEILDKAYDLSYKDLGGEKYDALQVLEKKAGLLKLLLEIFEARAKRTQSETDMVNWAESCLDYAVTLIRIKKYEVAESHLQNALHIFEKVDHKQYDQRIAVVYFFLAELYFEQDEYSLPEKYLLQAIELYKECSDKDDELLDRCGLCYNNLAYAYKNMGQYAEAEDAYVEEYKICKELADKNPEKYNVRMKRVCERMISLYELTGQADLKNKYLEELARIG